jgi:hypothetical protein
MKRPFTLVTPDRLQIREGGGCMSVFGLPFFGAGVFLFLSLLGIVPVSNADELPTLAGPLLVLMAIAFTAVGGVLVFGRSWTTVDRVQREVIKQMGLIVPLRQRTIPLDGCTAIRLGFVEGDSDTSDKFPVALKRATGPDLTLWNATVYDQARACARALAELLHLEVEDATTSHAVRLRADQMDLPLRERIQTQAGLNDEVTRPRDARTQVTRAGDTVTIVMPLARTHWLWPAAGLIPLAVLAFIIPGFAKFFRQSHTPDPISWVFLGFLTLFFGILPTLTGLNAFLRSRRGATIVDISEQGLRIRQRGAWTTSTTASLEAADILDVDYTSRESAVAAARRAAEQQVMQSYPDHAETAAPRVERLAVALTRFVRNKGLTIKTRKGLTTVGQGLDDEEIRYLHSLIRRALIERTMHEGRSTKDKS